MTAHPSPPAFWAVLYCAVCLVAAGLAARRAFTSRREFAKDTPDGGASSGWVHTLVTVPRLFVRRLVARHEDGRWTINDGWLFVLFFLLFWAVEAWATHAAPFHLYAPSFLFMLPSGSHVPEWLQGVISAPADAVVLCKRLVDEGIDRSGSIPVEVVLMEATIAYVAVRGTDAVGARPWGRPFLAAIGVLAFDALLDPVVAESYGCDGGPRYEGLGLWRWFWDESVGEWLGIPLYNFASWFGGAVIAIAVPMLLIDGNRDLVWRRDVEDRSIIHKIWAKWGDVIAILLVIGAGVVVRLTNPDATGTRNLQTAVPIFVLALVATAFVAGLGLHQPKRSNPLDWCLIMPGVLLLGFAIAVRLFHGASWGGSVWWPIGLFVFCFALVIFPYLDTVIDGIRPARRR